MNLGKAKSEFRTKYMSIIPDEMEEGIRDYLRSLAQGDTFKRRTLFNIAGNHESEKCREWAVEYIKTYTIPEDKKDLVEMWIRKPYPSLRKVVLDFIKSHELKEQTALCAAVYILLDEENEAQKTDSNFENLELLIQDDPMLLAPIAERLTEIRLREFQRVVSDRTITVNEIPFNENESGVINRKLGALTRSLRTSDWSLSWQIMKESSFVCIAESLRYFKLSKWIPKIEIERELFQYLVEYVGFDGWEVCSDMLQEVITDKTQRYKGIEFKVMNILKNPPPNFKLSPSNLKFELDSLSGIQRKFLRVKTGDEILINVSIPYYFDVEIDEIGLKSIICPLSSLGKDEFSWIIKKTTALSESEDFFERRILRYFYALRKLIEIHQSRDFKLIITNTNKFSHVTEDKDSIKDTEKIIIGFDFGNSTSAITFVKEDDHSLISGKELLLNPDDNAFTISDEGLSLPSVIYYRSGGTKLIGWEAEKYREENETFKLMKRSLRRGWSSGIKVEERRIKAPEATKDFIFEISKKIKISKKKIKKICFTSPVDAPIRYQETIKGAISEAFAIHESFLEVFDEATACILGIKEEIKPNISTLVVDVGGGTTDIAVVSVEAESPISRIYYRTSEDIGGADIEGIAFYECREKIKTDLPKSAELIEKCRKAKHELVDKNKMTPFQFSSNAIKISFEKDELNDWLKKENFDSKFKTLIENSLIYGQNAGSGEIKQFVLAGGGSKWPLFLELLKPYTKKNPIFHIPDTFAVARGVARAGLGFSLQTSLPYPLGILRTQNGNLIFEIIMKKGTRIPSTIVELSLLSKESLTNKIELDLRRRRIKNKGEKYLLFGNEGEPYLKSSDDITYYEPFSEYPLYLPKDDIYDLWVNKKGKLYLINTSTNYIYELGSIL